MCNILTIYFDSFFSFSFFCSFFINTERQIQGENDKIYRFGNIIGGYWVYVCIFLVCPLYFDSWSFVQSWFYPSFFNYCNSSFLSLFPLASCMKQWLQCLDLTIDNWSIFQFLWGCCINECTFNKCKLCFHYFIKKIY